MKLRLLVGIISIHMLANIADASPFAYILNRGSGDVTVVDANVYNQTTPLQAVVNTVPVGTRPYSIAVSTDGNFFVVANQGDPATQTGRSIKVINADTLTVVGTYNIDYVPGGMALSTDGTRLYVADQTPSIPTLPPFSNRVVIYSVSANGANPIEYLGYLTAKQPNATGVNITMPEGVVLDESAKRLFIANSGTDRIVVYDTDKINDDILSSSFENAASRLSDIQLPGGTRPTGLAVAQGKLYVAGTNSKNVKVYNTADRTEVATYNSGTSPYNVTASPDGSKIYVANAGDQFDKILVINVGGTSTLINSTSNDGTYACSAGEAATTPARYLVTNVPADELSSVSTDVSLTAVGAGSGILVPAGNLPCSFGNFIGPKYDYTITTSHTGNGSITPAMTAGASASTVLAKANSTKLFSFAGTTNGVDCITDVKVDAVSVGKPITYTIGPITKNYNLDVTFGACSGLKKLDASVSGSGFCSITSNPAGINLIPPAQSVSADFATDTLVVLSASAGGGSQFKSWSGCDSVNGSDCSVTMSVAKSVVATCDIASLLDNEAKRGSKYYDNIAQALADTGNTATLVQAVGVPSKTVSPITCSATQSVKLEGAFADKSFSGKAAALTPVGSVTISGGCSIEFDGISIQ